MKRIALAVIAFASLTASAQQPAAAPASNEPQPKAIAIINGDVITDQKLDQLYSHMSAQMKTQYDQNGGKAAFLDNYLRKRLLVQEAIKHGFDKRADVQAEMDAAKETALFEAYVRDVVSSTVVKDSDIRKFYDENKTQFATPESVNVRHIIIMGDGAGPRPKSKQQAAEFIQRLAEQLREQINGISDPAMKSKVLLARFIDAAKKYSEDGAGPAGGSLGWVTKGSLDPAFEQAAFALEPGQMSAVVESRFGYHLILIEGKKVAGTEPFDNVRTQIREFLQSQHMSEIMQAVAKLSGELRADSKVSLFPENLH